MRDLLLRTNHFMLFMAVLCWFYPMSLRVFEVLVCGLFWLASMQTAAHSATLKTLVRRMFRTGGTDA